MIYRLFAILILITLSSGCKKSNDGEAESAAVQSQGLDSVEGKVNLFDESAISENNQLRIQGWNQLPSKDFVIQNPGSSQQASGLISLFKPDPNLVKQLEVKSKGKIKFRPTIDISVDGRFAVVGFVARKYSDFNHLYVFRYEDKGWQLLNELKDAQAPRDLDQISIFMVYDSKKIYFTVGGHSTYVFDLKNNHWLVPEGKEVISELNQYGFTGKEHRTNLMIKNLLNRKVDRSWIKVFVQKYFAGEKIQLRTAINNQTLIALASGEVVGVKPCPYGQEHVFDKQLSCKVCPQKENRSNCLNPVQNLDYLSQTIKLRSQFLEDQKIKWLALQPQIDFDPTATNPYVNIKELKQRARRERQGFYQGGTTSPKALWRASQGSYPGRVPFGWTVWKKCAKGNTIAKFMFSYPVMVIGFAATDESGEFETWRLSLDTDKHKVNGMVNHKGFYQYMNQVQQCVNDYRKLLAGWNIEINYIVGHSIGGAAATIYSQHNSHPARFGVYTFGAPKTTISKYQCVTIGRRYVTAYDPRSSNLLGIMSSFSHDISHATVLLTEKKCRVKCDGRCCPWGWFNRKYTDTQKCTKVNNKGCQGPEDCAYYFRTEQDSYGSYL